MSRSDEREPSRAGHAVYSKAFLRIYDPLVLGFFSRFVWRCPNQYLVDRYRRMLGAAHLDIGPGTGYFLEAAEPTGSITLLDPNPAVLAYSADRLSHLRPSLVEADVTRRLPISQPFDSVALNYVIHCLPSTGEQKAAAISNAASILATDGVLFGATVLGDPRLHTWASRRALEANNRRGIFDNLTDDASMIASLLDSSFEESAIETVGAVAVFSARRPRVH